MIYSIAFITLLAVIVIASHIYYSSKQANKIQGKEDQQRYGAKYSVGKIVSYKKIGKWWVKK